MKKYIFPTFIVLLVSGCTSLSPEKRTDLNDMAERVVSNLEEKNPGLKQEVDSSVGYLVIDKRVVKVPVFGAGRGRGVVVNNETGQRTYVKISRLEIGGGWGARSYKLMLVFHDPQRLKQAESGKWAWELGAEATAGKLTVEGSSDQVKPNKGYTVYTLTDAGASATYTLRTIRLKPYRD